MVDNVQLVVSSFVLILVPFLACGVVWVLGRVVLGDGEERSDRVVPAAHERSDRVIPGTRSDEPD
mgnify:CR=1 FL=1